MKEYNNQESNNTVSTNPIVEYSAEDSGCNDVHVNMNKKGSSIPHTCEQCWVECERIYNMDASADKRYMARLTNKFNSQDAMHLYISDIKGESKDLDKVKNMTGICEIDLFGLAEDIQTKVKNSPNVLHHDKIGFDTYDGKQVYKFNGVIGVSNKSRYTGKLPLGNRCDPEQLKEVIKKYVVGKPYLTLVMIMAVYGFVLDIAKEMKIDLKGGYHDMRLTANIVGKSSVGKSSATLLAASVAGDPTALLETFNNTDKKIAEKMFDYKSIPLVLDELIFADKLSPARKAKMLQLLFALHAGRQRGRVNPDTRIIVQESSDMATNAVIISTELSILKMLSDEQVKGHKARLLEINCEKDDVFFDDKDSCEEFCELIGENYGWGKIVIEHILNKWLDNDRINTETALQYARIKGRLSGSAIQGRFSKRIALLLTVGKIISEAIGVDLNLVAVEELLIKCVSKADEKSESDRTYDLLNQYTDNHSEEFCKSLKELVVLKDSERENLTSSVQFKEESEPFKGAIVDGVLYIPAEFLGDIINGAYLDFVKAWAKKGLLEKRQGEGVLTYKVTIANHRRIGLYCIKLNQHTK